MLFPSCLPPLKTQARTSKNLVRQAEVFLQEELHIELQNNHFLLAVSGGADSMALLCIWQWLSAKHACTFSVVHLNHGLRQESFAEAENLKKLCTAWNIDYFTEFFDIPKLAQEQKLGFEEMSRKIRYELYAKYRKKCRAAWICLGHHLQDVQEDMLMRLIRGTGWPALAGMVAKDEDRHILRPLLMQEAQELRHLLQNAGISWAEDASNSDTKFFRNRVRHTLLPLFQAENPQFSKKAQELWHMAQYDKEHWQNALHELCRKYHVHCQDACVKLPADLLKQIDKATRLRLYLHAIHLLKQDNAYITGQARAHTFFALDHALTQGRGNTIFQLPGNICAYLKKGSIVFKAD